MGLDVNSFITERGGDPKAIEKSQERRGDPIEAIKNVQDLFAEARKKQYTVTQTGSEINNVQKQIGMIKKEKGDATELLAKKVELEERRKREEVLAKDAHAGLKVLIKSIGNIVHDSVPVSATEDDNAVITTWAPEGFDKSKKIEYSHHEIMEMLNGYDSARGVKLVGHRGYILKGVGLRLSEALRTYAQRFLESKNFEILQTPSFLDRDLMAATCQLSDFEENLYGVLEDLNEKVAPKFLIATSEQPISAMHNGEWLTDKDLPMLYGGASSCFRKEAGSHGRDAWGLFRVHEFQKIEQFVICSPKESWDYFQKMQDNSMEFMKSLGLPFQVVAIVSGGLNLAAAKKYDLEAWYPFQSEYKELCSTSNCTDYQSRELEVRYGMKKSKEDPNARKDYVHMLNGTLCAVQRTLTCILENYIGEKDGKPGVHVPKVLQRYMDGLPDPEFLPFTKAPEKRKDVKEVTDKTAKLSIKK